MIRTLIPIVALFTVGCAEELPEASGHLDPDTEAQARSENCLEEYQDYLDAKNNFYSLKDLWYSECWDTMGPTGTMYVLQTEYCQDLEQDVSNAQMDFKWAKRQYRRCTWGL